MATFPTRRQYMTHKISHHDYYLSIAREAGVLFVETLWLPEVKAALEAGDEHLNSIPLERWDALGAMIAPKIGYWRALKAHEETDSKAVRVCMLKAAAKEAAQNG